MKLLYITQYYPPEVGAGAVRSEAMARYLSEDDWDIDIVTEIPNYPTGEIHDEFRNQWVVKEYSGNISINRIWVNANQRHTLYQQLTFFISFMFSCFFYVISNPKKYDIIYVTSPPIFAAISGCLLNMILGGKFVLEIRDLWPDSAVDSETLQTNSPFIKIGRKIEKWLYNQADLIIPVTPQSEKIIQSRSNGTPTKVIENGVDLNLFKRIENPASNIDESYDDKKFRVGYVGSLGVIHDLKTFVKAAKACEDDPNIEFVIVGDGGQNNQLQDILEEIKPNNVQWVGLKKHSQIPYYISSFDLAINPVNDSQAFQTIVTVKFYEYLACETPVINVARGALEEIGERSNAAITIPVGDYKQLAQKIKHLKAHPHQLNKLAENTRNFVKDNYSRKDLAQNLSRQLKQIV